MIGKRIAQARKARKLTQVELTERLGWGQSRLSNYEKGIREPSFDDLERIANALGVTSAELLSGLKETENTHEIPQRNVPIISFVQAGEAHEAADIFEPGFADEYLPCPVPHSPCTYALRVQGESMTSPHGRSYPAGSIIFVDPELRGAVASGDRIIARLKSGEVTFKLYISEGGQQFLKPLNQGYPPITEQFEVLGKVIGTWMPE